MKFTRYHNNIQTLETNISSRFRSTTSGASVSSSVSPLVDSETAGVAVPLLLEGSETDGVFVVMNCCMDPRLLPPVCIIWMGPVTYVTLPMWTLLEFSTCNYKF